MSEHPVDKIKEEAAGATSAVADAAAEAAAGAAGGGGVAGAVVGALKGLAKNKWVQGKVKTVVTVAVVVVAMCGLLLAPGMSNSPISGGVEHVHGVAEQGSETSGFEGWAQRADFTEQEARVVTETATENGLPPVLLAALVAPTSGPYPADSDVRENADKVAKALHGAQKGASTGSGWDMLTGTAMCQGDVLVAPGEKCPSGTQAPAGGAGAAKQVREAWVVAMMSMEGLPEPKEGTTTPPRGNPAPPDTLEGDAGQKVTTIATKTFSLPEDAVSVADKTITVATDKPLMVAGTVVSRAAEIGVDRVEADGKAWSAQGGWTPLEPEEGIEDEMARQHVRIRVCDGQCGQAEEGHLTREQADAVYGTALSWLLGTPSNQCSAMSGSTGTLEGMVVAKTGTSEKLTIDADKAANVAAIVGEGRRMGVSDDGIVAALMAALAESRLANHASPAVPESLNYPHQGEYGDLDSIGLFQQRPSQGWGGGVVADIMDPARSAGFFYTPLMDVMGAQPGIDLGAAIQKVQKSGAPDAYAPWEEAARQLYAAAGGGTTCGVTGEGWVYPLPKFYPASSSWQLSRCTDVCRPHWGTDISAPLGTPILSANAGTVVESECGSGGCLVIVDSTDGYRMRYLHMKTNSMTVKVGDQVTPGQQIGLVDSTGHSFGHHLHVEASPIDKIGTAMWCAFDVSWADRCPNPIDTFMAHGVNLNTGEVTPVAGTGNVNGDAAKVIAFAKSKMGPGNYVSGGTGPDKFDCSGLVQAAYAQVGRVLPRRSQEQCKVGRRLTTSQAQPGDIVCYTSADGGGEATHVDIYEGGDMVVGAMTHSEGILEKKLSDKVKWYGADRVWVVRP